MSSLKTGLNEIWNIMKPSAAEKVQFKKSISLVSHKFKQIMTTVKARKNKGINKFEYID